MAAFSCLTLTLAALLGTVLCLSRTFLLRAVYTLAIHFHQSSQDDKSDIGSQQVLMRRETAANDLSLATGSASPPTPFSPITGSLIFIPSSMSPFSPSVSTATVPPLTSPQLSSGRPSSSPTERSSDANTSDASARDPPSSMPDSLIITPSVSESQVTHIYSSVENGKTVVVTQTSRVTTSAQPSSSTPSPLPSPSGGLSNTNKIMVGVVVGVGGSILLGFAALFFILKRRNSRGHQRGWTFWRKNEKGGEDFFNGELGVRDRDINQGSNF